MLTTLSKLVRPLVAAVLLGLWTGPADAGWWTRSESKPTHQVTSSSTRLEPADPAVGVVVIAAGLGLFVFLAWVAVRVGGGNLPANDLPE